MTDFKLSDVLPKAGARAEEEAKVFRSKLPVPRRADKLLVAAAVDHVAAGRRTLAEALKPLTPVERDYVVAVLTEWDQWRILNGFARETALRDDKTLLREAAKAIEETR